MRLQAEEGQNGKPDVTPTWFFRMASHQMPTSHLMHKPSSNSHLATVWQCPKMVNAFRAGLMAESVGSKSVGFQRLTLMSWPTLIAVQKVCAISLEVLVNPVSAVSPSCLTREQLVVSATTGNTAHHGVRGKARPLLILRPGSIQLRQRRREQRTRVVTAARRRPTKKARRQIHIPLGEHPTIHHKFQSRP